ncbi:MAG: hypothetical protein HYS17_09615 [Micavibrio aeruginosavorus]|uniref:Uncharacterized protein n=1 Tax=Micavibrio aeruginosavorus TaxID=349221 RepID=A0A7T5R1D3_9BACT|nr:MAG: hypothetical protein HYS17_09615 [Micavibrio aeruginosavorus]
MHKSLIVVLIVGCAFIFPVIAQSQTLEAATNIPEPGYSTHGCILPPEIRDGYDPSMDDSPDYDYFKTYIDCVKIYKKNAKNDLKIIHEAIDRSDKEIAAAEGFLAEYPPPGKTGGPVTQK